jgi:hypothetical protein
MAIPQSAKHATCLACHWTAAVLAYETKLARRCLCPRCQHVWDTTKTAYGPRLKPKKKPFD